MVTESRRSLRTASYRLAVPRRASSIAPGRIRRPPPVPSDHLLIVRPVWRLAAALAAAVAVVGCGTSDDRDQARGVVERFYDALRHDRAQDACAQLSAATASQLESQTGQSCRGVITRLDYDGGAIIDTQVYITNAKVDQRNGESTFLGREPTGWKITALACKPADGKPRDRPFECEVEA